MTSLSSTSRRAAALFLAALPAAFSFSQSEATAEPSYPDPTRFEDDIAAFEAEDQANPPPENAILCIGSSSMRGWHPTIEQDLAPLTVIPRGFGGSNMNDVLHYADRIVIPYQPRAILLYEGDNDTAGGIPPEKILATFHQLVAKVHAALPETRFYVLSIKPSPARWDIWPIAQETNQRLEAACAEDDRLVYIDIAEDMLGADGKPRPGFFVEDELHMKPIGYESWTADVRPVLLYHEVQYEGLPQ